MASYIGAVAPHFTAQAYKQGSLIEVNQETLAGKWNVLFFYPADFTFVCPTELGDLQDNLAELNGLGVEVYSVSTDTHFVHKAWADASDTIKKITYAMIGDPNHAISKAYGVLNESTGLADRATIVVDPDGKIQIVELNADGVGRNAAELVRKIKAAIYTREHPGEACPAKWDQGAATLTPSLDLVGKI